MHLINVLLFAGARERIQADEIEIHIPLPATIGQLKQSIREQYPVLIPFVDFGRISMGNDFVEDSTVIETSLNTNAIALIPPVSGG